MKRLMTTTALVTCLAMPLAAENHGNAENANQAQQRMTQEIQVTSLIDRQIYMPVSDNAETMTKSNDTMSVDEGDDASDNAEAQLGEETGTEMAEDAESDMNADAAGSDMTHSDMAHSGMGNLPESIEEAPDNWRMVGEIEDLLVAGDGQVTALIVDAGGFLGVGANEKWISIKDVSFVRDADDEGEYFVVYNGDRAKFEETASYEEETAKNEGVQRASEAGYLDDMERSSEEVAIGDVNTEELLGAAAYGSNGEWVGEVSELSLGEDGKVSAVIVDVGGFLGLGEKPVALSMDQVTLVRSDGDELRANLDVTEEELDQMEEWTGDQG